MSWSCPRWPVVPQLGGSAATLHRGHGMVSQVLQPLATRSTAAQPHHCSGRAGLVDEHQPRRVKHALLAHLAPACAGYVRTLPLRRVQSFFKADVAASKEPPHRAAAACDLAFAHRRDDLVQRQVRQVNNQTQQKLRVLLQRRGAAAARLYRNAASLLETLHPDHHHAGPASIAFCRLTPRGTGLTSSITRARKSMES